ncbi:ABC transporter substrate-binding protein [Mesorhizobium sp. LjNodule214]|uniref:ABC transporter substrate-binding protein n=1 Tax=Mesorhizobium sp. LjNodule214 TaxID=3342252 RepID=UPI003ED06E7A
MPVGNKKDVSRRSFLMSTAVVGASAVAAGGVSLFNVRRSFAQEAANPADILAKINVGGYVKKEYRDLYKLADGDELWDPAKDWIRTVDWEKVRSEFAGKTVKFAIGAADMESAADGLKPFEQLSGMKVELVPIPDDSMYDKVLAEFISGNASFDALQFFSPWLGDFAGPGFLAKLDDYAEKWKLPLDDFYDTYRLNYGYFGDKGLYGIPFDCDIQMVHVRPSLLKKVTGKDADAKLTVPTYDEMIRLSAELNKVEKGVAGVGMMGARGFWSTYTWEHIAAQHGVDLFNDSWEPVFNSDAGIKALETILALKASSAEGVAGWGWGENRAAWLGGQLAMNISWQDSGTQATRPDQSRIVGDVLTIYEPRVQIEGARFAPPNIAGSTSCVTATSQNPEGAFLMLAFLTSASIMAMNEANANGVAPGYKSVLKNEKLRSVSQPAAVWADSLDYAWCAPRIPGMFEMEQALGNEINKAIVGQATPKEALDAGAKAWKEIMTKNGFFSDKEPFKYAAVAPATWAGKGKTPPV